jgi:hypothetical protein
LRQAKSVERFNQPCDLHNTGLNNTLDWDCAFDNEVPVAVEDINGVTYIKMGKNTDKILVRTANITVREEKVCQIRDIPQVHIKYRNVSCECVITL